MWRNIKSKLRIPTSGKKFEIDVMLKSTAMPGEVMVGSEPATDLWGTRTYSNHCFMERPVE